MSQLLSGIERLTRESVVALGSRELGQFFTPPPVARFMASLISSTGPRMRILDPGAGVGILAVAAAESLLRSGVSEVHLTAVENDRSVLATLHESLSSAKRLLGPGFSFDVAEDDFLDVGTLTAPTFGHVDAVICNPPYRKISPKDRRGGGTVNTYTRFMEIASEIVDDDGQIVFIVPRSYSSGLYFKDFRRRFHRTMQLFHAHLFESRSAAFRHHDILQETIIIGCRKTKSDDQVQITSSDGIDGLGSCEGLRVPLPRVVDPESRDAWVHLPTTADELELIAWVESQPESLDTLGLRISTGHVVPFRNERWLLSSGDQASAEGEPLPLYWMQHVRDGEVRFPLGPHFAKPEWISARAPRNLTLPAQTCVLLRRFSAKEDARRLIAAPLLVGQIASSRFAVENHVNVITGAAGTLHPAAALGLARVLNSRTYDGYYRVLNGSTQVGATEIRATRLPSRDRLEQLGTTLMSDGREPDFDSLREAAVAIAG